MTSVNTSCKVVNNSSKAVVVLDAYQSATTVPAYSTATGYQQSLKALPLSTGGTVLAAGATATVTLNDTYVSNGQTKPSYIYQLLVSEPAGLFPVANVGEVINFTTEAYPDVVITDAEAANMSLGFAFMQNIMAYPGSQLATGFVSAMNSAQGQSSSTSMVQTVDAYFNSTKSYQGLDFASYLAMSTHMKQFAWTWGLSASGAPGRTYYLYAQSDASGGGSSSSSSSGQGSVTITLPANAPSPADPTDANSGYVATLSNGSTTSLSFSSGQFVDNPNVDIPGICLQGTYALKSTFTQKSTDNVLWPVLIGTVNGVKVIGVSQEPADAFTTWLKSLLPKSFDDLFNDFMKIMGLAMAIDFLKQKLSGKKEALDNDEANENGGEPPNQEQQAEADAGAEEIGNEAQAQAQDVANHMGVDDGGQPLIEVPQEAGIPQAQIDANVDQVQALDQVQGDAYQGAIDEYRGQLEELAEIGTPPALEDAAGQLMEANEQLSEARVNSDFSDVSQSLTEVNANINLSVEQLGSEVSEQVQDNIKESQVVADEYEESAESIEEQSSQIEEGTEDFEPEFAE